MGIPKAITHINSDRRVILHQTRLMSNLPDPRQMTSDIVESFPEARAREVAGVHMRLEVRDKKFGWFMENHHGDGRLAINCKALPGIPESMVAKDPVVYHIPKYVGKKGWIGIWVDEPSVNWDEVRELLLTAYQVTAPKSLQI